jgi:hypothetical protein
MSNTLPLCQPAQFIFWLSWLSNKKNWQLINHIHFNVLYGGCLQVSWTHNSESELCGGAVMVSFSKYLPWQAMFFSQRSTHFSKTCCRPLITSKFPASQLPFHGWKSPEVAWGRDLNWILCSAWKKWTGGTPLEHPPYSPDLTRSMQFLDFSNHEKGAPR